MDLLGKSKWSKFCTFADKSFSVESRGKNEMPRCISSHWVVDCTTLKLTHDPLVCVLIASGPFVIDRSLGLIASSPSPETDVAQRHDTSDYLGRPYFIGYHLYL